MKSKVNKEFVQKPAEFFKNSSLNFLENERSHAVIERECVKDGVKNEVESVIVEKKIEKELAKKPEKVLKECSGSFLENERYYYEKKENGNLVDEKRQQTTISQSQQRYVFSAGSLKRYVTTCYFQPKQIPVCYSETMILNIGSSKKKFFQTVYYKNTLQPHKWSEMMHTTIKREPEPMLQKSELTIPVEKSEYHYISLEPQQQIAVA